MSGRILVVEDDSDLLEVISYFVIAAGYEFKGSADGSGLIEEITAFQPDLILMDVMLGRHNGRVLCAEIKGNADTKDMPVILMSGTHDFADDIGKPGAPNDFIAKPFMMKELLQRIERQLTRVNN